MAMLFPPSVGFPGVNMEFKPHAAGSMQLDGAGLHRQEGLDLRAIRDNKALAQCDIAEFSMVVLNVIETGLLENSLRSHREESRRWINRVSKDPVLSDPGMMVEANDVSPSGLQVEVFINERAQDVVSRELPVFVICCRSRLVPIFPRMIPRILGKGHQHLGHLLFPVSSTGVVDHSKVERATGREESNGRILHHLDGIFVAFESGDILDVLPREMVSHYLPDRSLQHRMRANLDQRLDGFIAGQKTLHALGEADP